MSITVDKAPVDRRDSEFCPMIPAAVRAALRGVHYAATALYLEIQALPTGFAVDDGWLRSAMGWTASMLRKAKAGLAQAGLYAYDRIRRPDGQYTMACRYLTNVDPAAAAVAGDLGVKPQVTPNDPSPTAGIRALIPTFRERYREGRQPHNPDNCRREAAGAACRQCAKTRAREERNETVSAPTHLNPSATPVADVLAREAGEEPPAAPGKTWRERAAVRPGAIGVSPERDAKRLGDRITRARALDQPDVRAAITAEFLSSTD